MVHQASPNFCQAQDPEDLQDHQMRFNINKFWKLLVRIMPREKNVLKFLFPLEKIENIYLYHKGMLNLMLWIWWWCKLYTEGRSPEKKVAVLLFFSQMMGGGPAQIFCPLFTNCILGQFYDGEGGGDPCPNFLAHWRSKKWYKLYKLGGGGVEVIWTKSKRTATFFRETFPKCSSLP